MKRMGILWTLGLFLFTPSARADWTTAQRLTWTSGDSEHPVVAAGPAGVLHVVWYEETTAGNNQLYYKKSTNGGTSWTPGQRLTWTSGSSEQPAVAVDSASDLHMVWNDNTPGNAEVYYKKSTDAGNTWTASQRLTWTSSNTEYPAIAVDPSDGLHVVWHDYTSGNAEIYYKKSTDGGTTWSPSQRLTWTSEYSLWPAIAADSAGRLHVVWQDETPPNDEVYYSRSTDGGATWTTSQRLTWTSGYSYGPVIAVNPSGNLHLVWADETPGNTEMYYKKSTNSGVTWTASQRLTWSSGYSWEPSVAAGSPGNLHVVWFDWTPENPEIYYKKTTNGGVTWGASQRLTWTSGYSGNPSIGVDSTGDLHVVWSDQTPGNVEIYYKKYDN